MPLDMFFVLSGFLITALLLREQSRIGGRSVRALFIGGECFAFSLPCI